MKEMPERIYIFDYNEAMTTPLEGDTEYIRKDIVDDMIKTAEDHAYFAGSEYARKELIENACQKLEKCMYDNLMFQGRLHRKEVIETFIEDFKKHLEEQV